MQEKSVEVVIVWSGGAWLRCAIELWEHDYTDIIIVGDRAFDDAHTTWARGWINASLATMDPDDSPDIHAVDTYREGQYVAHPDLVETLADHAPEAIADLVKRWADFHKEDDGRLTQRFFGAHTYRRTVFSGDQTGKEMIRVMTQHARTLGIPYLEHVYVYDLLVQDGRAYGIRGVQKDTDEDIVVFAKKVVFATGWFSNVYQRSSSRNKENFGDGIFTAFRAGALIGDIELVQFHPTGLLFPEEMYGELVTEAVRGEWGILLNTQWERFMTQYDPGKMELSTRDVVARANFAEIRAWRGTEKWAVLLDISHRSKQYIQQRLPKMYSMILAYNNVDISKQPVEVAPTSHYTMGGIWFDADTMQTTIDNFYAAGECTMWVHGANRLGGNSLMETMVFGKKVAQAILAAQWGDESDEQTFVPKQKAYTSHDYSRPWWMDAETILQQVRSLVWDYAGIVRTEQELLALDTQLTQIQKDVAEQWLAPQWSLYLDVMMYTRVQSVLILSLLICKGARARKESRGAHYRTDYPETSSEYNKNYVHQLIGWKLVSSWKDLPQPSLRLQKALDQYERTKNYGHSE